MDSRERITAILNLEEPDRVGYVDSPWRETIDRWELEGLPKAAFLHDLFAMDIYGVGADTSPKYDGVVYEEGVEWRIARDACGVKSKYWRDKSGVPLPIEPVVSNVEEFEQRIEPLLDPDSPMRISSRRYPFKDDIEKIVREFQKRFFVTANVLGPYEYARHICGGHAPLLTYMLKDTRFASRMFDGVSRFLSRIGEGLAEAGVDGLWLFDDIGYSRGPFFSPATYRKILQPAHLMITEPFRRRGLPRILHTDGNVKALIPDLMDAGITCIQPVEAKAGMDVRELKTLYGERLAFMGNIDARTLASPNPEEIKQEVVSKISVAAQGGGYIIGSDHSVPPEVSLPNYQYFLKAARKYGNYPLGQP